LLSCGALVAGCGSGGRSENRALVALTPLTLVAPPGTTTTATLTPSPTPSTSTTEPATALSPTTSRAVASTTTSAPLAPVTGVGQVTAIGDSVMIDYEEPLEHDIPGVNVQAEVGRQWSDGEAVVKELRAQGQLGSTVVIALGTNGVVEPSDFTTMMSLLSGVSRVVFVTIHVDRPWQDPDNQVIETGASQYPNTVIADWATLADQNPQWLYSDGTHLPPDGPGAQALAALIASKI
jgi:hypothetical protein